MTREHVFRSSWKRTLDVNKELEDTPLFERKFIKYGLDNSEKQSRSEDLFSVIVKRVCAKCNNTWMNDLDSVVEPWIFDPLYDENRPDPKLFRRWAIKIALLRCYYENPLTIQPGDLEKFFAGEDIPEWHIFIGHTRRAEHRHAYCGMGPISMEVGGKIFGLTQVLWTLGHSLVVAIRVHGTDEISKNCFRNFKMHNRVRKIQLREVLPTAKELPSMAALPALSLEEVLLLAWFYSSNPISPIADAVREANEDTQNLFRELGRDLEEL